MLPLRSAQKLAWCLGIPLEELRSLAKNVDKHYRSWKKTDPVKGKERTFFVPDQELKRIQRRILHRVLSTFDLPNEAHGGIKGRSPKTNAARHLGKALVVNIDIRDFFPSVRHKYVAKMFRRDFGCGRDTTWILTRLTTVDGQLPQGAPTSTMIANILLAVPVDGPINARASQLNVEVTRFIDDFSLSGNNAGELINETARATSRVGLRTWRSRKKLKITPNHVRQEVTGLTVNSPGGPSVPREKRERVRAAIHQLRSATPCEFQSSLASVKGRLNHVRQFNQGSAKRLHRQLDQVLSGPENE